MKLAVMQPYFFPYIGYFQLMMAVDHFVFFDDVNYITRGWINRNVILGHQQAQRITLPVKAASQNRHIDEHERLPIPKKLLDTLYQNYRKAPCFGRAFPLIEQCLTNEETNLARFLSTSLIRTADYLGIETEWLTSSQIEQDPTQRGTQKILDLCQTLQATHYVNLPGGTALYDREQFRAHGIALEFIAPHDICYPQFSAPFVPMLSIIDLIMFNTPSQCQRFLRAYDLR
ncbi:MAG: WbqC family protein [Dechloromonas sp.]|nr:WbqC family protein [Dechloromonas sp.]